jgi:hypothetical protein
MQQSEIVGNTVHSNSVFSMQPTSKKKKRNQNR